MGIGALIVIVIKSVIIDPHNFLLSFCVLLFFDGAKVVQCCATYLHNKEKRNADLGNFWVKEKSFIN
jgi:hypothetical protein